MKIHPAESQVVDVSSDAPLLHEVITTRCEVNMLLKANSFAYVVDNLDRISEGLHREIALHMIEHSFGSYIVNNLEQFHVDHKEIAEKLIEAHQGECVARYFDRFVGLNAGHIIERLIQSGQGSVVALYLNKFPGVDHLDIAKRLIFHQCALFVAIHIKNFNSDKHAEIADLIIEAGVSWAVADNCEKFVGLDLRHIAEKVRESGHEISLFENPVFQSVTNPQN